MIFKESWSDAAPYRRMLVKYKAMLVPSEEGIDPNQMTGKRLDPLDLKRWLDEQKEVILIDTRNDYEFEYGSFANAINLKIEHFRDFGDAIQKLPQDYRDKPVVMFCTGGIRCEKATPIAMKRGFKDVYQLEGGILDYFKATEGAHWQGGCFVFDERVSLGADLRA
jgi:predicted sulfurtransferase